MAKLTKAQHEVMAQVWDCVSYGLGDPLRLMVSTIYSPPDRRYGYEIRVMRNLAAKGLLVGETVNRGELQLTEAGLAYCREHFGEGGANA